jgi:hypothetical protein
MARTPAQALARFESRPVEQIRMLATTHAGDRQVIAYTGATFSPDVIEWAVLEREHMWLGDSWRLITGHAYPTTTLPVAMFLPFGPDNGQIAVTGVITPGWQASVVWRDGSKQTLTPRAGLFAFVRTKVSADVALRPPAADWTRRESARIYLTAPSGNAMLLQPRWYWGKPEPGVPDALLS